MHKDIRVVTLSRETDQIESLTMQAYYNEVFLPCAKNFILQDASAAQRTVSMMEATGSIKSKEETVADRLLQKMQLNSPLKETLPHHLPEKVRTLPFSGFSYHPRSPIGNDYLISRSPDAMRTIAGLNHAV